MRFKMASMTRFSVVCCVLAFCWEVSGAIQSPQVPVKQWNLLSYNFEYDTTPTPLTTDKNYFIPENVVATGLAITHDRVFVSTPRLFSGVPATLSVVPLAEFGDSPTLQAYPDWSFHTAGKGSYNCSDLGLVSVYRMRIDSCNRLWVLDAGISRSLEDYEVTCPPKILVFDLSTNQLVRRIDFPRQVRRGESLFTNLIIDETTSRPENSCDDVFVYISDTVEPAIVVYDSARDLTWRVTHPAMYPDPDFAQSEIRGDRFVLMDGIVGLAFDDKAGVIYFQPLATDRIFSITKQVLRAGPVPITQIIPVKLLGKKSSQGISLALSPNDGSIIFSPLTETAVASYNPQTNQQRLIAYDSEALQFVADMTFSRYDPGAIYILSSRFQKYFLKNLNTNEVNVRIIRIQLFGSATPTPNSFSRSFSSQYTPQGIVTKPDYTSKYFNSIRQPYQFETVGIVNRGYSSPFSILNSGENLPQKAGYTLVEEPGYAHVIPEFGNLIRVTKSLKNVNNNNKNITVTIE